MWNVDCVNDRVRDRVANKSEVDHGSIPPLAMGEDEDER